MDDVLVKPANLAQLKKTLAKWLPATNTGGGSRSPAQSHASNGLAGPIDFTVLNMIVAESAGQIQVLRDFHSHIRSDRKKLTEQMELGEPSVVESTAHRMKGSCRMVGAQHLATACEVIEQTARNGDIAGARAGKAALDYAFSQLEAFLGTLMNPENPGET
jgi:HPt (histidine-containing phosphotransfer) domain-containing protein